MDELKLDLNKIYGVRNNDEIYDSILKDLKNKDSEPYQVLNKYLLYFWNTGTGLHTIRNKYTKIRKMISDSKFSAKRKKLYLDVFSIPDVLLSVVNAQNDSNTLSRANNRVSFDLDSYVMKMEQLKALIHSNKFDEIRVNRQEDDYILANLSAIYIAMNSGRRSFEIFKTLSVVKFGKKIYYKGLSKKRIDDDDKFDAFLIDDDYDFMKKCIANVRKYYKFETIDNTKFNNNYQANMNKYLTNYFKEKMTYSKLRDMFVAVNKKMYMKEDEDENRFIGKILNHEMKVSTQDHYKKTKAE